MEELYAQMSLLWKTVSLSFLLHLMFGVFAVPSNYPQSFTAMPKSPSSVMLQWAPPDPPNGFITNFTIYINYTNGSGIDVRTVSGDISFYLLQSLVPHQLVGISISASNVVGEGPKTETIFIRTLQDSKLYKIFNCIYLCFYSSWSSSKYYCINPKSAFC